MSFPDGSPEAVARALVAYGRELAETGAVQVGGAFTTDPAADAFIKSAPEAFLMGVLFTQGIPAERAWSGPYLLSLRLGHFDLERMVRSPEEVARAFETAPALHRFVRTLPGWVCSAASRLLDEYDGRAASIWPPGAHVIDVTERLLKFRGIGEKKAAMAVEILARSFGVPLAGLECGTVAYDVHVRRVFLRAGLVEHDTAMDVHRAAEAACPEAPGSLDLATWLIGREWCRPRVPDCERCRLGTVCPRYVDRTVVGVGARSARP
ncbi:MAG: hypothetical protein Q8S43_03315 [Actinomycetota bacterium]|nr:hypothetical protein [Actinomycetota bacterium]MDP3629969.1 hypothetical protein [Actinomycetota bacterium]